jgi:hypothetical protein
VTYETGVKTGVRLSQPDSTLDFRQLPLSTEAKLRQRSIVPVFLLRPHLAAATLGGPVTTNSTTRILRTCSKSLAMRALFCSLSAIHHRCDTEPMGPTFYGFWGHFSGSCTVRRCTHGDLAFQTTSCKAAQCRDGRRAVLGDGRSVPLSPISRIKRALADCCRNATCLNKRLIETSRATKKNAKQAEPRGNKNTWGAGGNEILAVDLFCRCVCGKSALCDRRCEDVDRPIGLGGGGRR